MGAAQSSATSEETTVDHKAQSDSVSPPHDFSADLSRKSSEGETSLNQEIEEDFLDGKKLGGDGNVDSDGNAEGNSDGNSERETREQRLERKRLEMDAFYDEVVSKREQRNKALGDIAKKLRKMEKMEEELEKEREEKQTLELHCKALKEVNKITKEMLRIRETQVSDLKMRLKDVEKKLMESPEEIKVEYEKQMTNYKKLRELYEQRAVAAELEHKTMIEKELAKNALLEAKLKEIQEEIQAQLEKYKENKKRILEMETNIQCKDDEINNLNESLTSSLAENHILNSQMTLVNNLFSNMLINPMINLDLLIKLIQDNYLLIIDLVNNHEINDTVSLLVDLEKKIDQETTALQKGKQMKQLEDNEDASCSGTVESETFSMESSVHEDSIADPHETSESTSLDKSHIQKEIANNLPKVWRILIELLNTHQEQYENKEINENFDSCYKNIKTNSGKTHQVISVSQTFIRLKHLILEKNHLNNQLVKLKTLNNHLEIRLNQSEQRLNTVTTELKKTWNVVNKLKLQHKQLYTHEKILKYELKHKRNIINDLKIDLEYVREKWDLVKEKNEQNEMDYKVLRNEFALRRLQYDGGRSTSESGISTDTEDDNVEIVETNDESEDDKSEVVETQSEHDVAHTNSVMSIEEDDQDDVEELENESNANGMSDLHNATSEPAIDVIENVRSLHFTVETNETEAVSLPSQSGNTNSTTSDETDNVCFEEDTRLHELQTIPEGNESNENISKIFLNNKVTIKTIGGQIKVVSEHISSETNSDEITQCKTESRTELLPVSSQQSTSNTIHNEKDHIEKIHTKSEAILSCSVPEPSGEESRAKQLTRQERVSEENLQMKPENLQEYSTKDETTTETLSSSGTCSTNHRLGEDGSEVTIQNEAQSTQRVVSTTDNPSDAASSSTLLAERSTTRTRTPEEILEARNARLKRLEDQTKNLFHKMSLTSQRSDTLSERLEELHDYYGTSNERHSPRRQRDGSEDSDSRRSKSVEKTESRLSDDLSGELSNMDDQESSNAINEESCLCTVESGELSNVESVNIMESPAELTMPEVPADVSDNSSISTRNENDSSESQENHGTGTTHVHNDSGRTDD